VLPGGRDFLLTVYGEPGERVPDTAESRTGFDDLGSKTCWVCRLCGAAGVLRIGAVESAMRDNRGVGTKSGAEDQGLSDILRGLSGREAPLIIIVRRPSALKLIDDL
jgi:hypothetical protein